MIKSSDNKIIAVDAKVTIDDNALFRQKDFIEYRDEKEEDPSEIVIDEWVGQWIALWLIPHSFIWGFTSFVFFRIFDILKPGPVELMDEIKSGTGIMMDDVVAGILALLVTQSLVYFI